ncbi:MAG TPA: hypothetical protein VF142_05475, partial [Longimicrobium sp.]
DSEGELRHFLALFGHELARLRGNLDQLHRDFYIDACQDWVVPYLADLVGTEIVFNTAARNRADVRDTLRFRRQKGTLAGLEALAAGTAGQGVKAVEMLERLLWTQNLNHLRPRALHTVNLADASAVDRLGTPFDGACRTVDLRPPSARGGLHQVRNVAVYTWSLPSHRRAGVDPASAGSGRFRFDPLGADTPLYAGGERGGACAGLPADPPDGPDPCHAHADHVPIRTRDFRDHPQRFFGQPGGFAVYEDGILLCRTLDTAPGRSTAPAAAFARVARGGGLLLADPGLFGGAAYRVEVVNLAAQTVVVNGQPTPLAYSPAAPFAVNLAVSTVQAQLAGDTGVFTAGIPFQGGAPAHHRPFLLLRIRRTGADAVFPESELIVRSAAGRHLLVFLPELAGIPLDGAHALYVADDGGTYHARADHAAGAPDRNPDSGALGAFLPRHLARGALGQVRPRPGIRPVAHRVPVGAGLCCWDQPLPQAPGPGQVAFDPERGRFVFAAGEAPAGELTADYRFARGGEAGAGPFFRGALLPATLTVAASGGAAHPTIQDAVDAAPDGHPAPVVIEIADSRTYAESLQVAGRDFAGGLVLRAAPLHAPVVSSPGGPALRVAADSVVGTGADGEGPGLMLDGLVMAGGDVEVAGDVPRVALCHCTLHPATVAVDYAPVNAGARLEIERTLAGAVAASLRVEEVRVEDSVIHHPGAGALDPGGVPALDARHAVRADRTTVLGGLSAQTLDASDLLLHGPLALTDAAGSCLRYSRVPAGAAAGARAFRCTSAVPVFHSLRPGEPAYGVLAPATPAAVLRGGEEGGEMGAWNRAGAPWR